MAYILQENKTITLKGMTLSSVYMVIDRITVDKKAGQAEVTYYTFTSSSMRDDVNNSLKHEKYTVTGEDYDTYFSPSAIIESDSDQFALAYTWLGTQVWTPEITDGETVTPAVLFSDLFESDEV